MRKSTKGWHFLVTWKDGTESLVDMTGVKKSHLAEYAKPRSSEAELALAWQVPHTLRQSNGIVSAVKACMLNKAHKYGIEIPGNVEKMLSRKACTMLALPLKFLRKDRRHHLDLDGQKPQDIILGCKIGLH